jgi:hypothetical protein
MHVDLTGADPGIWYDQVVVNGDVSLGGATLNLSLGDFVPAGTETFTLINNTGAGAIVGEFAGIAQGATVDLAGVTYFMDYEGGSGNDVVLSPTPPVDEDADFDGDGDVDGTDLLTWQRNLGSAGGQSQGNANGDSVIDGADLAAWVSQFSAGSPAVASATAIPEPGAAAVLISALGALALVRRRSQAIA